MTWGRDQTSITLALTCVALAETYDVPVRASVDTLAVMAVAIHNYAGVSQRLLGDAQDETALIYKLAGIELSWVDPLVNSPSVRVNILSSSMTTRAQRDDEVLGFAIANSHMVYVLYDHVADTSRQLNTRLSRLLCYVMAHEIGHLLLPGRAHTSSGLMSANLNGRIIDRAWLRFTPEEVGLIQESDLLRRRIRTSHMARVSRQGDRD
jgi:hypothetical protein